MLGLFGGRCLTREPCSGMAGIIFLHDLLSHFSAPILRAHSAPSMSPPLVWVYEIARFARRSGLALIHGENSNDLPNFVGLSGKIWPRIGRSLLEHMIHLHGVYVQLRSLSFGPTTMKCYAARADGCPLLCIGIRPVHADHRDEMDDRTRQLLLPR